MVVTLHFHVICSLCGELLFCWFNWIGLIDGLGFENFLRKFMTFEFFAIVALIGLLSCVLVRVVGWALSMGWPGELSAPTGPCSTTTTSSSTAQTALQLQ